MKPEECICVEFPPSVYSFGFKNKLKSPSITSCYVELISNSSNSSNKLFNTSICSSSVSLLYKFIKMYLESLIGTNSESLMETFRITDEEKKNRFVK